MRRTMSISVLAAAFGVALAADSPALGALNIEAHGFVSFGYLRTWENNWLAADTTEGTDEFYEAALNVIARPWDQVRLGAQLFVRDLGVYDKGAVQLDWAYVDVRLHTMLDVQAGRVKIPMELYNETQVGTNHDGSWITAVNLLPLRHWSLKAEYQYHDGNVGVQVSDNPRGIDDTWQVVALKTTVDF